MPAAAVIAEAPVFEPPMVAAPVVEVPYALPREPKPVPWWERTPEPVATYTPTPTPMVEAPVAEVVEAPPVVEAPAVEDSASALAEAPWFGPRAAELVDEAPVAEIVEAPVVEAPITPAHPVAPDFEWEPISPPVSVVQPSMVEAPLAPEQVGAPSLEWEPGQATSEEAPVVELPVVEPVDVEETASAEGRAEPTAPVAEAPESELVLTRDFLEEPLPGSGWGPVAVPAVEEALEDFLPVVPDEFPPLAAAEIERPTIEAREGWPGAVWSEPVTEFPAIEAEEPGVTEIEEQSFEAPVVEAPVMEAPMVETSVMETPVMESPVAEAPVVEVPVVEAPVAGTAPVDDLKARIEETRRRIRRELEQPFVAGGEAEDAEDDWTISPVVPVASKPVEFEPSLSEAIVSPGPTVELGADVEPGDEEAVDYDSMRSRIEVTRSRLKAKAFDAMMTGESALLGRDTEDAEHRRRVVPAVDSEVNETIETSLREEED
jgi:hypothetical protein